MSKRKSLKELSGLVLKDIEYQADSIAKFKDSENSQVKELYKKATVRREALEDVLQYITNGTRYQFLDMDN